MCRSGCEFAVQPEGCRTKSSPQPVVHTLSLCCTPSACTTHPKPVLHTLSHSLTSTCTEHIILKVVPIIKCICTVFTDNFRNISTNSSILGTVCRGSYDEYVKHERNDPMSEPWDFQGNETMQFLLLLLLTLTF